MLFSKSTYRTVAHLIDTFPFHLFQVLFHFCDWPVWIRPALQFWSRTISKEKRAACYSCNFCRFSTVVKLPRRKECSKFYAPTLNMQPTKAIFGNLRLCSSISSMTRWYFKHYHSPLAAVSISAPIKITLSAFQSFKPKKMARQKNKNKKKKTKKLLRMVIMIFWFYTYKRDLIENNGRFFTGANINGHSPRFSSFQLKVIFWKPNLRPVRSPRT